MGYALHYRLVNFRLLYLIASRQFVKKKRGKHDFKRTKEL